MNDDNAHPNHLRRKFLKGTGLLSLSVAAQPLSSLAGTFMKDGVEYSDGEGVTYADGPKPIVSTYPQKDELILVHSRPPHLETPFSVFNDSVITPNNRFFVRYHLAGLPESIDTDKYRINIKGLVDTPLSLSLDELKSIEGQTEIVAVQQCTGNSRGYSSPRVFGAQLGNGAMGNARFKGVPLKNVLAKAGVQKGAVQVTFNGLDKPVKDTTPDFRKALPVEHAMSGEPMIVWEMNGEPLPYLNGFPVKLIVPGYFATYWVKHLSEIEVIDHTFDGFNAFFMTHGYRIPDNDCACEEPDKLADKTTPVTRFPIRSFVTSLADGDEVKANSKVSLKGIAFDGGSGIKQVEVSIDEGSTWTKATLGEDLGRFSFREWTLDANFTDKGRTLVMVRATSNSGETQPTKAIWNRGGYYRNVIEQTDVKVV